MGEAIEHRGYEFDLRKDAGGRYTAYSGNRHLTEWSYNRDEIIADARNAIDHILDINPESQPPLHWDSPPPLREWLGISGESTDRSQYRIYRYGRDAHQGSEFLRGYDDATQAKKFAVAHSATRLCHTYIDARGDNGLYKRVASYNLGQVTIAYGIEWQLDEPEWLAGWAEEQVELAKKQK